MIKKTKKTSQDRLQTIIQAGLLAVVALIPLAYVGVKNGYIEGYSTIYTVPKFYLIEALIALIFVLWAALRNPSWSDVRVFWPIAGAIGIGLLSVAWTLLPSLAIVITSHYLIALLLCVMLSVEMRNRAFLTRTMGVLVGLAAIESIWGISQFLLRRDLGLQVVGENVLRPPFEQVALVPGATDEMLRAYGSFPHPNVLAALLVPALLILLWALWQTTNPLKQFSLGISAGLVGVGFLLTFSRTAWVIGAVALLAMGATLWQSTKRIPWGLLVPIVCVFGVALLISKPIEQRASADNAVEVGVGHREVQFEAAGGMIIEQPWGVGAGNYSPVIDERRQDLTPYERQPVHNLLLLVAVEIGIIGAGLALWFVLTLLWRTVRLKASGEAFQLKWLAFWAVITALAMGVTDHFFLTLPHGLWLLAIVIAFAVSRLPVAHNARKKA